MRRWGRTGIAEGVNLEGAQIAQVGVGGQAKGHLPAQPIVACQDMHALQHPCSRRLVFTVRVKSHLLSTASL
jgi:hypothetical protein